MEKIALLAPITAAPFSSLPALAADGEYLNQRGDHIDQRLDDKGNRIDRRLDRKGNRVDRRH